MTRPGASESKKTLHGPFMAIIDENVFRPKSADLPEETRRMAMAANTGAANKRGSMRTLLNDTRMLHKRSRGNLGE